MAMACIRFPLWLSRDAFRGDMTVIDSTVDLVGDVIEDNGLLAGGKGLLGDIAKVV